MDQKKQQSSDQAGIAAGNCTDTDSSLVMDVYFMIYRVTLLLGNTR